MTWEQRIEKTDKLISLYEAYLEAYRKELDKHEAGSLAYCKIAIDLHGIEDEIESKKMFREKLIEDKEQQEAFRKKKEELANENADELLDKLRQKIASPLTKDKDIYRGLLLRYNSATDKANVLFQIAQALQK